MQITISDVKRWLLPEIAYFFSRNGVSAPFWANCLITPVCAGVDKHVAQMLEVNGLG